MLFYYEIPNKQERHKIAFNHLLDIDFKEFMNLYKKCTSKPSSFLVNDTTLASENLLCFRKESFKKSIKTNDGNRG